MFSQAPPRSPFSPVQSGRQLAMKSGPPMMGTPQPTQSVALAPANVGSRDTAQTSTELMSRHYDVTQRTTRNYSGDLVPPSTRSNLLRALKFLGYGFYIWNAVIFLAAFAIPFFLDFPYGDLNILNFVRQLSLDRVFIMLIVLVLPTVRFLAFSWSSEFYQYVITLFLMEASILTFVLLWWSPGLPVLAVLMLAGLVNSVVVQQYFTSAFANAVNELEDLVPKRFKRMIDHTCLTHGPPTMEDMLRLMGVVDQLPPDMYANRCGVYGGKDTMSHVAALKTCYTQGMQAAEVHSPWPRNAPDLTILNPLMHAEGLLTLFTWYVASALTGLWLGQAVSNTRFPLQYNAHVAYILVTVVLCAFLTVVAFIRTQKLCTDALGVAVAEKEFLAHDTLRHDGERAETDMNAVDISSTNGGGSPFWIGGYTMLGVDVNQGMGGGRLNLTFLWLCAYAASHSVGASYLGAMCMNMAAESRFMMNALTAYEFKKIMAAKWELTIPTLLVTSVQLFVLMVMFTLYFGTYFESIQVPSVLIGVLGGAVFLSMLVKMISALSYSFSVLGGSEQGGPRDSCISESIMFVVFLFMMVFIVASAFLVPIMFRADFPFGSCEFYGSFFPSQCHGLGWVG